MSGIYIHIPFCRQACHYCNFHFSTSVNNKSELVQSLVKEIELRHSELTNYNLSSIYFGGGTPSLLDQNELELLFSTLKQYFKIGQKTEVTLEANPEDITQESLDMWHALGINRLSVGIQSFHDKDLSFMNRAHDAKQSHQALTLIRKSKIQNVTADLMFGLIDSNMKEWSYNVETMLSYDLNHLSIYNLTVEEQTVFANWKMKNKIAEPSTKLQHEQYQLTDTLLSEQGYEHYEISNYSKPNHEAIHNTNYWNRVPYLGIGPSAHSYIDNIRSWNIANNIAYIKQLQNDNYNPTHEKISTIDRYNELIMLGFRTKKGLSKIDILQLPKFLRGHFLREIISKIKEDVIIEEDESYKLSSEHWYVSDHIASELFYVD